MKVCNNVAFFGPHVLRKKVWILIPSFRGICCELLTSNQRGIFIPQNSRSGVYEGKNLRIKVEMEGGGCIPVAVRSKA